MGLLDLVVFDRYRQLEVRACIRGNFADFDFTVFIAAYTIMAALSAFLRCQPIAGFWDQTIGAKCYPIKLFVQFAWVNTGMRVSATACSSLQNLFGTSRRDGMRGVDTEMRLCQGLPCVSSIYVSHSLHLLHAT